MCSTSCHIPSWWVYLVLSLDFRIFTSITIKVTTRRRRKSSRQSPPRMPPMIRPMGSLPLEIMSRSSAEVVTAWTKFWKWWSIQQVPLQLCNFHIMITIILNSRLKSLVSVMILFGNDLIWNIFKLDQCVHTGYILNNTNVNDVIGDPHICPYVLQPRMRS